MIREGFVQIVSPVLIERRERRFDLEVMGSASAAGCPIMLQAPGSCGPNDHCSKHPALSPPTLSEPGGG